MQIGSRATAGAARSHRSRDIDAAKLVARASWYNTWWGVTQSQVNRILTFLDTTLQVVNKVLLITSYKKMNLQSFNGYYEKHFVSRAKITATHLSSRLRAASEGFG